MSDPKQKTKDIALPHAKVFLVPFDDLNKPVASALSDLSGRFSIKTTRKGTFTLCVEATGFPRFCARGKDFRLTNVSKYYSTLRLPPPRNPRAATVYGEVTLADGTHPRGFEPLMGVNSYGSVELTIAGKKGHTAYINNFGEYIVPSVPIRDDFSLKASVEKEARTRSISAKTKLQPLRSYRMDFPLRNSPPRIRLISTISNGKPVQRVAPGSKVTVKAVTDDRNTDQLEYRWVGPDGVVVGPTSRSELELSLPGREGRFPVTVLVSDNRGGYTRSSIPVIASSRGVPFSGSVVDENGAPVGGALIQVNTRVINANSRGRFAFEVPESEKYVLTVRDSGQPGQPAYGPVSFVYTSSVVGGRWTLRQAQVLSFDPKQPISIRHKRTTKDCRGSRMSRVDWRQYLGKGLIQWQDGRGNINSLAETSGRDRKAAEGVMRLLSRINPSLPGTLAETIKVRDKDRNRPGYDPKKDYLPRIPCLDGIQVDIPANALESTRTKQAPTGMVQIALSTVDLMAGDQMPGDYSATDSNGNRVSMESFGAGSVEIRSGSESFNLKSGMKAKITIPVDATQIAGGARPDPKIPLLFYDPQTGVWRQEGEATLNASRTAYEAEVTHFSSLNADVLKSGQSCVAVEVDPDANFSPPFDVEVTMPPSVVNPNVIQVRTLEVTSEKGNVIYNLPNDTNIVLTPIKSGVRPDGSIGDVPAGVFVVNTGGPQLSGTNLPPQNPDGSYYSEANGQPTGPCGSRVTLTDLTVPPLGGADEFLEGFAFEASNITEFEQTNQQAIADAIVDGAEAYYLHADPRGKRASFNLFKSENDFGEALDPNEVEFDAQYANSGDLGFGRDMHCRRNFNPDDNAFDYACYVTNYNQPPDNVADQVDADDALAGLDAKKDATVAMEFSRVENPQNVNPEFPDNIRKVKFYVYATNDPNGPTIKKADLDNFGERPVPQLCVICHGGQVASEPADINDPSGPKKGAFSSRADIMSMNSNFLPFDLHLFNFPATKDKTSQQAAFKNLNREIVRGVADANGLPGAPTVELIDTINPAANASQLENAVITNWDGANTNSDSHRFYRDVFARACRTCHVSQPFSAPPYTNKTDFQTDIGAVQNRVCSQKIMPHAKRTNDIFWTSLNPNMPGFLQLYGQNFPDWAPIGSAQCGLFFQGGSNVQSVFTNEIYPILFDRCTGCHSSIGNANWELGNVADTYNLLLNAIAVDGVSNYIVPGNPGSSLLFQRISAPLPDRMPPVGASLFATDADADGISDGDEILNWINGGALGP